ncbi:MAG: YtxH domain-containing protein [Coriobacteriia bacterium]
MYEDRRGGSVFGAFLLGGLIGAALGLLFAPRSGKEMRDLIAEKSGEYWGEAEDFYVVGKEKVTDAVAAGQQTASEKGEQLRSKIDEARGRLQDQVARSASSAKDKIADTTPAVIGAVDKAADAAKTGVGAAAGKAQDSLDFVAKKATAVDDSADAAPVPAAPIPGASPAPEA